MAEKRFEMKQTKSIPWTLLKGAFCSKGGDRGPLGPPLNPPMITKSFMTIIKQSVRVMLLHNTRCDTHTYNIIMATL